MTIFLAIVGVIILVMAYDEVTELLQSILSETQEHNAALDEIIEMLNQRTVQDAMTADAHVARPHLEEVLANESCDERR